MPTNANIDEYSTVWNDIFVSNAITVVSVYTSCDVCATIAMRNVYWAAKCSRVVKSLLIVWLGSRSELILTNTHD